MDLGPIALANLQPTHYLALQQGTSTLLFALVV
jgi:hypothetical protein